MGTTCQTEAVRNLGKYTLLEKLGEGCLGPVYKAFDQVLGRTVAIRILCDGIQWDAEIEARFLRECQSVAGLQHPNIAAVFGVGKEGQSPYIVTEFLGGDDLGTLIARRPAMPWEEKLSVLIGVADGLSHAHRNGILHRDLRPGKIHLNGGGSAKIRDFDIAHILMRNLARPGVRWGVPIYLSPEQIQHGDCDERSDMFSAGIIFYELLTYLHPFHDPNGNKTLDNILFDTQLPTFDRFPDAPPGIWSILKTCLAKDPKDRYRSMDEFSNACKELLKDLAEDSQLMLAELQAALPRLRKAAAQPGAPEGIVNLLQDVQKLSGRDEEADYGSLDRLMAALVEQYPAIQAIAGALPMHERSHLSLLPEELAITTAISDEAKPHPSERKEVSPPEQPTAEVSMPRGSMPPPDRPGEAAIAAQTLSALKAAVGTGVGDCGKGLDEKGDSGAARQHPTAIPLIAREAGRSNTLLPDDGTALPRTAPEQRSGARMESRDLGRAASARPSRRNPKPAYLTAGALLSILLMGVAVYMILGKGAAASLRTAWSTYSASSPGIVSVPAREPASLPAEDAPAAPDVEEPQEETDQVTVSILLKEAQALAAQHRFEESNLLIRRILEIDPTNEAAIAALMEIDAGSSGRDGRNEAGQALQKRLARVSALIGSGRLQPAKLELDKLQKIYPQAPAVLALRKRMEARNSEMAWNLARKEGEHGEAARRQNEEAWTRRLAELLAHGKYDEARGAVSLWLAENPSSSQAQKLRTDIEEVRRGLKAYESAMAENRYQDALDALGSAQQANPADSNLAGLRRQLEARQAAARATLSVYRLGEKATLLLDGKPLGNNGEMENESVAIGRHTLAIENAGGVNVSRSHEFLEGQRVVYVYDSARRQLRPVAEAERELLAQRRATEEVHQLTVEHNHGLLRGSCKGVLRVDSFEVEYKPTSGLHGFRIPFKCLKLRVEGRSLDFSYALDDGNFHSFRIQDAQAAANFKRAWDKLKSISP